VYDSLKSSNDESIRYLEVPDAQLQQLPSKVSYSPQGIGIHNTLGNVFQHAAAYNPGPNMWPFGVTPGPHDVNQDIFADDACIAPRRQRRYQKRRCDLLIATQLSQLQEEDPGKLLIVRKINRLGFNSARILQQHYERYGVVTKVLLSNKHEKDAGAPFPTRLRPSGIGFVLFESAEGAAEALAEGPSQIQGLANCLSFSYEVVAGVEIVVRAFEKRRPSGSFSSTGDDDDCGADSGSNTPEAKSMTDQNSWTESL